MNTTASRRVAACPRRLRSSRRAACRRAHAVRGRRLPRGRGVPPPRVGRCSTRTNAPDDFLETACVATVAEWPDEDLTGAQFGPYHLESRIGGGGMGEVYRARDTRLGRTVAIKVLLSHIAVDEPARERFEREARVVAGLNHPHICTLHDIGTYQRRARPRPGAVPRHGVSERRDARGQACEGTASGRRGARLRHSDRVCTRHRASSRHRPSGSQAAERHVDVRRREAARLRPCEGDRRAGTRARR